MNQSQFLILYQFSKPKSILHTMNMLIIQMKSMEGDIVKRPLESDLNQTLYLPFKAGVFIPCPWPDSPVHQSS